VRNTTTRQDRRSALARRVLVALVLVCVPTIARAADFSNLEATMRAVQIRRQAVGLPLMVWPNGAPSFPVDGYYSASYSDRSAMEPIVEMLRAAFWGGGSGSTTAMYTRFYDDTDFLSAFDDTSLPAIFVAGDFGTPPNDVDGQTDLNQMEAIVDDIDSFTDRLVWEDHDPSDLVTIQYRSRTATGSADCLNWSCYEGDTQSDWCSAPTGGHRQEAVNTVVADAMSNLASGPDDWSEWQVYTGSIENLPKSHSTLSVGVDCSGIPLCGNCPIDDATGVATASMIYTEYQYRVEPMDICGLSLFASVSDPGGTGDGGLGIPADGYYHEWQTVDSGGGGWSSGHEDPIAGYTPSGPNDDYDEISNDIGMALKAYVRGCYETPEDALNTLTGTVNDPTEEESDQESEGNLSGCPTEGAGPMPHDTKPVSYATGVKTESAVDLVVKVPGDDFVLRREYSSNPVFLDATDAAGSLIGRGWKADCFRFIVDESTDPSSPQIRLGGPPLDSFLTFTDGDSDNIWDAGGAATQQMTSGSVTIDDQDWAVWTLRAPGEWTKHFVRAPTNDELNDVTRNFVNPDAKLLGLLLLETGPYTENTRLYLYHTSLTGGARLHNILINGTPGERNSDAIIQFNWLLDDTVYDSSVLGMLGSVQVLRPLYGDDAIVTDPDITVGYRETRRVDYYYATAPPILPGETEPVSVHADVGQDDDLIQVIKTEHVDLAPGGVEPVWKSITQYRYHDGTYPDPNPDPDRLDQGGADHQLKMVIMPEQVEYHAQRWNQDLAESPDLGEAWDRAAADLLTLPDNGALGWVTPNDGEVVADLAAKIIGYDAVSDPVQPGEGRVLRQFIQSACGCGGSATQGVRYDYSYGTFTFTSDSSGDAGLSTTVEEHIDDGSWTLHRTRYYDMRKYGSSSVPYLVYEVVAEPAGRDWVNAYEYTNGLLTRQYTPSAVSDYTPSSGGSEPSYTPRSGNLGLAYEYTYVSNPGGASNNRISEVRVRDENGNFNAISKTTYKAAYSVPGGSGDPNDYSYLPDTIERYRVEGNTDADNVETTWFEYGFRTVVSSHPAEGAYDIGWIRTRVEPESETENGPSDTVVAEYDSYRLFDEHGRIRFESRADNNGADYRYDEGNLSPGEPFEYGNLLRVALGKSMYFGSSGERVGFGRSTSQYLIPDGVNVSAQLTESYVHDVWGRTQTRVSGTTTSNPLAHVQQELREDSLRPGVLYRAEVTFDKRMDELWNTNGQDAGKQAHLGFEEPVIISWRNASGRVLRVSKYLRDLDVSSIPHSNVAGSEAALAALHNEVIFYALKDELSRKVSWYGLSGLLGSSVSWGDVNDDSTELTTSYEYDELGRVEEVLSPTGSYVSYSYDVLDRKVATGAGVTGESATTVEEYFYDDFDGDSNPEQGVGNGLLSWTRQYTGEDNGGQVRLTERRYDHRDRLAVLIPPEPPIALFEYDNLDRPTRRALFSGASGIPASVDTTQDRGLLVETQYSQRGLVYRTRRAIEPQSGSPSYLDTEYFLDAVGRAIETQPIAGPIARTRFDSMDRPDQLYLLGAGLAVGYDPGEVFDSELEQVKVVRQEELTYWDDFSPYRGFESAIQHRTVRQRLHLHASGMDTEDALVANNSVPQFSHAYRDIAFRPRGDEINGSETNNDDDLTSTKVLKVGAATGGNSSIGFFTLPAAKLTAGERHSWSLYNARGAVAEDWWLAYPNTSTDNDEDEYQRTLYLYDDLDRVIAKIENYVPDSLASGVTVDGEADWDDSSGYPRLNLSLNGNAVPGENITTSYGYDSAGRLAYVVAHDPDGVDRITQYQYGVTMGDDSVATDSLIDSNDLLREINYPGEGDGLPATGASYTVSFSYNALGEVRSMTDQNGTVHEYERDRLGRVTHDTIVSYGTSNYLDETIDRISTEYDDFGRVSKQSSERYESGYVVDSEVEVLYTDLWEPRLLFQNPDGAVTRSGDTPTGDTKVVTYSYNSLSDMQTNNRRRPTGITYPDGVTEWNFDYGTSGGLNDAIDRVEQLVLYDGAEETEVVYGYLGLDNFATVEYSMANVMLDRTYNDDGTRFSVGQTPSWDGTYPGWDEYFRPRRQAWIRMDSAPGGSGYPTLPPIFDEAYGHDLRSNRTNRDDVRPGAVHKYVLSTFTYDGSDRLQFEQRKGVDETGATYDPADGTRVWALDTLGNWDVFGTDSDGDGAVDDVEADPSSDFREKRIHDGANEMVDQRLAEYEPPGGGGPSLPGATAGYDNNGNLVRFDSLPDQDTRLTFHYDAWNRLVYVEREIDRNDTPEVDMEIWIRYNARNWRISEHVQTRRSLPFGGGGTIYDNWLENHYYSNGWQLLRTDLDTWTGTGNPNGTNKSVQYFWGLRALDDLVMRRLDSDADGDFGDDTVYFLTDALFSPRVAVGVADAQTGDVDVRERYYFNPYGQPRPRFAKDVNWDGQVNSNDRIIVDDLADALNNGGAAGTPISHADYIVDADINNDGMIDADDKGLMSGFLVTPLRKPGEFSGLDGLPLRFGLAGYHWVPRLEMYLARNRYMDPRIGRWITRDPKGYVDGPNLYQYAGGHPLQVVDPMGLQSEEYDFIETGSFTRPITPVQIPHVHAPWGSSEFASHYFRGNGAPVGMSEIGLDRRWIRAVDSKLQPFKQVASNAASLQDSSSSPIFTYSNTTTNVKDEPLMFWIGGSAPRIHTWVNPRPIDRIDPGSSQVSYGPNRFAVTPDAFLIVELNDSIRDVYDEMNWISSYNIDHWAADPYYVRGRWIIPYYEELGWLDAIYVSSGIPEGLVVPVQCPDESVD